MDEAAFIPLSRREAGASSPDGPYEGVPPHLHSHLLRWLTRFLDEAVPGESEMAASWLANDLRIPPSTQYYSDNHWHGVMRACNEPAVMLDALDWCVGRPACLPEWREDLEGWLDRGGSVWRVTDGGLQRRVLLHSQDQFDLATDVEDRAGAMLAGAWSKAYGRQHDPVAAWSQAIKAVEAWLVPIVLPKDRKATLGRVLKTLTEGEHKWEFFLPGVVNDETSPRQGSPLRLVRVLELLWPNPGRHEGAGAVSEPTIEQARAAVHVAVLVTQWHRGGEILRKVDAR